MNLLAAILGLLSLTSLVSSARSPSEFFERAEQRRPTSERQTQDAALISTKVDKPSSFRTNKTEKFVVNGTAIPDVPWDIGESYAGLLPISADPNETRELYFWFFPTTNVNKTKEITIWLNGGPGCSSLSGLLTENGPFTWDAGTLAPTQNPYTWVNLTNMLWVEQPVGTGFSQGTPNITNEVELGEQFVGFYQEFVKTFDVQGWDLYITGESYAGTYIPYIADSFIKADDPDIRLKGIAMNDPLIGSQTNQVDVAIAPFVNYWNKLMFLNQTFLDQMNERADKCGYTEYLEKYLTFPPPQEVFPNLPNPFEYADKHRTCDVYDDYLHALAEVNPCFNQYHITDTCPALWSVLGKFLKSDYEPPGESVYFQRHDVQKAINAPVGTHWHYCVPVDSVFAGKKGDQSLAPGMDGTLQRVIEYTNNTIIGNGNLDMLLATNGTLLALQNVTWNGLQGLQQYPGTEFYVPYHPEYNRGALAGAGSVGWWGAERGLTYYQVQLAGHELPGYAPGPAYRMLELLLGRISSLSDRSDFTTQHGNFTGTTTIYPTLAPQ